MTVTVYLLLVAIVVLGWPSPPKDGDKIGRAPLVPRHPSAVENVHRVLWNNER